MCRREPRTRRRCAGNPGCSRQAPGTPGRERFGRLWCRRASLQSHGAGCCGHFGVGRSASCCIRRPLMCGLRTLELPGDVSTDPHMTGAPGFGGVCSPRCSHLQELLEVLQLGNNPTDASVFDSTGSRVPGPRRHSQTRYVGCCPSEPVEFSTPVESACSEIRKQCGSCQHQTRRRWRLRGWDAKGHGSPPLPLPVGPCRRSSEPWHSGVCRRRGDSKQPVGSQGRL